MSNDSFLHRRLNPPVSRRASLIGLLTLPAVCLGLGLPGGTRASGPVVLTVSGKTRDGAPLDFDMAALAALPQHTVVSMTPWYSQARRFTGPLLRDVLDAAGAPDQARRLRLTALNDYRIDIPMTDVTRYDIILARLLDGQPMAVRDKGPLFVMYPFDAHPELRSAVHYSRAIWQLRSVEVQ